MRIFLAGNVKSEAARRYLETLATNLEAHGFVVFLPHRDGSLPGKTGSEKGLLTRDDANRMGRFVFEGNLRYIAESDIVVAVLDGMCWGTTLELGYSYAYKTLVKPTLRIIGVYTDPIEPLDIMRLHACDAVAHNEEDLMQLVQQVGIAVQS
jgi:nucleoside 2-deoxyribosyltransferase